MRVAPARDLGASRFARCAGGRAGVPPSSCCENDDVRVLETRIGPGETVPVHTHRWPSVLYVLSTGHFVRRDDAGSVLSDTRATGTLPEPGTAVWIAAMPPHTVENVDSSEIRLLNVELKRTGRS